MYPNRPDKCKVQEVSRSPNLPLEDEQDDQDGTLSLQGLARFRISAEEYELDQRAKRTLALTKALTKFCRPLLHPIHVIHQIVQPRVPIS